MISGTVVWRRFLARKRDYNTLPFKDALAKHPRIRHWLSIALHEEPMIRVNVTKLYESQGHSLGKISPDAASEEMGSQFGERLKEHKITLLCFRSLKVDRERLRAGYIPVVHRFIRGLTSVGVQVVVDINGYCQTHMVGNISRARVEKTLFIPMLKFEGVHLVNLKSPVVEEVKEPTEERPQAEEATQESPQMNVGLRET